MPSKKITPLAPPPAAESPRNAKPGSVMVQKRVANVEPTLREKLCATCGRPFQLTPDQKYYLCPNCYRKAQPPPKRPPRKGEAQVLIQIHCLECGVEEYLDFVPSDPNATYCRACFSKRRREQKGSE
jgi:CxxC-x17-CxxC domain-containing protein